MSNVAIFFIKSELRINQNDRSLLGTKFMVLILVPSLKIKAMKTNHTSLCFSTSEGVVKRKNKSFDCSLVHLGTDLSFDVLKKNAKLLSKSNPNRYSLK